MNWIVVRLFPGEGDNGNDLYVKVGEFRDQADAVVYRDYKHNQDGELYIAVQIA